MEKSENPTLENEKIAMRATFNTLLANVVLTVFKMIAGVLGNSTAMIADAVHSLSDVLSAFVVIVGVKLSNRKPDKGHPYGHERFECVAAILLAALLLFTSAGIGWSGMQKIIAGDYGTIATPGIIALIAAIVTIVAKEAMYWYTFRAAKKINSGALMASAWHHRSDALSSVGSFIGILGSRLGVPILDPIAAIVISLLILKVAFDIFRDAVGKMTDKSCNEETEAELREVILAQESVLGIDVLKTRLFGNRIYVDVEISVDGTDTLEEAHNISHVVHDAIESKFPDVKHCAIHINPAPPQKDDL